MLEVVTVKCKEGDFSAVGIVGQTFAELAFLINEHIDSSGHHDYDVTPPKVRLQVVNLNSKNTDPRKYTASLMI